MFKQIFSDYSSSDDQRFTTLHRIILGLDAQDLYRYLQVCPREEINRADSRGRTALHWAAQRRSPDMIKLLLEHGSDPNRHGSHGSSVLHAAARAREPASISHLLKYGAQVDARIARSGSTPLLLTFGRMDFGTSGLRNQDLACAQRLLDAGADINAQNTVGGTPLLYASQRGSVSAVEFLLRNSAEVDGLSSHGETPLTVAIQANKHDIPRILIAHRANLAHHTPTSRSLLHEAAQYGDEKTLRLLTSFKIRGVKREEKCSDGKTARDLAGKREDVNGAWRLAFAELLASVDESTPEPSHESGRRFSFKSLGSIQQRLSDLVRVAEGKLHAEALRIDRRMNRFVGSPVLVLSTLFVLTMAIIWHTFAAAHLGKDGKNAMELA